MGAHERDGATSSQPPAKTNAPPSSRRSRLSNSRLGKRSRDTLEGTEGGGAVAAALVAGSGGGGSGGRWLEIECEMREMQTVSVDEGPRRAQRAEEARRREEKQLERSQSVVVEAKAELERAAATLAQTEVARRATAKEAAATREAELAQRRRVAELQAQQAITEAQLAATSSREHQNRRVRAVAQV